MIIQHRCPCTVEGEKSDSHFSISSHWFEYARSNTKSIKSQAHEQNVDQDEDKEQYFVSLHRSNRHQNGEDEISSEGKAELCTVSISSECLTEYTELHKPTACRRKPEECIRPKSGRPECVVVLRIEDRGVELGKSTEEDGPRDHESKTFCQPKLLRRSYERNDSQSEQTDRARIGCDDFDVGMLLTVHDSSKSLQYYQGKPVKDLDLLPIAE